MNPAEITDKLGLHNMRNRNWYIQVSHFAEKADFPASALLLTSAVLPVKSYIFVKQRM